MPDISSTLSAIDAATGCQQCEGPLGDSPSGDFCQEACFVEWHASRVGYQPDPCSPIILESEVPSLLRSHWGDMFWAMAYARYAYVPRLSAGDLIRLTVA